MADETAYRRTSNTSVRRPSNEAKEERQVRVSISHERGHQRQVGKGGDREDEQNSHKVHRKNSDDTVENSLDGQKRRRSSLKPVHLSLQTLAEHQSEISAQTRRNSNAQRHHRRRTVTETSQTDVSTESGSRDRSLSLYSAAISMRALRVTRRLSVASFTKSMLDARPSLAPGACVEPRYENTFRLDVTSEERFRPGAAQRVMEKLLDVALRDAVYSQQEAPQLCCSLSNTIKTCLRQSQTMPRYRVVCHVTIGQKLGQEFRLASRCLWDKERDNSACATYENKTLFAVVVVFAVYFE